ncbi:MAG: alginate O-acetyltransferase AlgF [Spirochaetales bacterium]
MTKRSTKNPITIVCAVFALLLATSLSAQEGLYGSGAPDDAAFVRVVNAADGQGEISTSIGEAEFGPLSFAEVSAYRPVATGLFAVRVGDQEVELVAQNGIYYTIAVTSSGAMIFEDPEHTDPAESQVFLYNLLADSPARLYAADRGAEVIGAVEPGSSSQVSINPVAVELVVGSSGEDIANVGDPSLERGQSYSVFVYSNGSAADALLVQAQVTTE